MSITSDVLLYDKLREQKKEIEKQLKSLSTKIQTYAVEHGVKDDKGSFYVDDGAYVFGKSARKSVSLNEERAKELIKRKGLDCIRTKEYIDEDAFESYVSDGTVTLDELESISDTKITFAISVNKKEDLPEVQVAAATAPVTKTKKTLKAKKRG